MAKLTDEDTGYRNTRTVDHLTIGCGTIPHPRHYPAAFGMACEQLPVGQLHNMVSPFIGSATMYRVLIFDENGTPTFWTDSGHACVLKTSSAEPIAKTMALTSERTAEGLIRRDAANNVPVATDEDDRR